MKTSEDLLLDQKIEALDDESLDREIDRQIQKQAVELPPGLEGDPVVELKVEKTNKERLRDYSDDNYSAASTINELEDQVWQAKSVGCDSIEATPNMVRHFCRGPLYPERTGFFIYKDVKVYIDGWDGKGGDKTPALESKP